jgi:hypothetical protein
MAVVTLASHARSNWPSAFTTRSGITGSAAGGGGCCVAAPLSAWGMALGRCTTPQHHHKTQTSSHTDTPAFVQDSDHLLPLPGRHRVLQRGICALEVITGITWATKSSSSRHRCSSLFTHAWSTTSHSSSASCPSGAAVRPRMQQRTSWISCLQQWQGLRPFVKAGEDKSRCWRCMRMTVWTTHTRLLHDVHIVDALALAVEQVLWGVSSKRRDWILM